MHAIVIAVVTYAVIALGELPDKTAIACLVLGARYRPLPVFLGAAAAFTVHVVLAVTVGGLIAEAPRRPVELVTSALFLVGAATLLRSGAGSGDIDEASDLRSGGVAGTAFAVVLVAEFGDATQILTATLAARYDEPFAVGIGSLAALASVAAIAVFSAQTLLRYVSLRRVHQVAGAALLVLAVVSLVAAILA